MKLTKEMVIQGVKLRKEVDAPELEGSFTVRPLTEGEAAQYRQACLEGLPDKLIDALPKLQAGGDPSECGLTFADMQSAQTAERRGVRVAAALGLSCDGEQWTPDEVAALPIGVPDRIAATVLDISGMTKESAAAARRFRADTGSDEPAGDAPDRLPDGGVD